MCNGKTPHNMPAASPPKPTFTKVKKKLPVNLHLAVASSSAEK